MKNLMITSASVAAILLASDLIRIALKLFTLFVSTVSLVLAGVVIAALVAAVLFVIIKIISKTVKFLKRDYS